MATRKKTKQHNVKFYARLDRILFDMVFLKEARWDHSDRRFVERALTPKILAELKVFRGPRDKNDKADTEEDLLGIVLTTT